MANNLTARKIETLKPGATRREYPDGGGLYLVLQPSGAASWCFRYRLAGKAAKLTLGAHPLIDLKAARTLAGEAAMTLARGGDPAANKRQAKQAAAPVLDGVEAVAAEFVLKYARKHTRERSWRETERLLTRELAPWRGRRLSEISKVDIGKLLDDVSDRGAGVTANRLLSALRRMGSWAVERGILAANPFAGVRAPSPEATRSRVLSAGELKAAWHAFTADAGPIGEAAKLLLLTGARLREVTGMEWAEVDLAGRVWTIPAARAKNGSACEVPLSAHAMAILLARRSAAPTCRYVFSANGRTALAGFSKAKLRFDAAMAVELGEPLTPWRFHDLRRSFSTNLAALGVAPHIIEAAINHRGGAFAGVSGIYNRHRYVAEKKAALDAWSDALGRITAAGDAELAMRIAA